MRGRCRTGAAAVAHCDSLSKSATVPAFSLGGDRYDQSSFNGRLQKIFEMIDMKTILTTDEELAAILAAAIARAAAEEAETGGGDDDDDVVVTGVVPGGGGGAASWRRVKEEENLKKQARAPPRRLRELFTAQDACAWARGAARRGGVV